MFWSPTTAPRRCVDAGGTHRYARRSGSSPIAATEYCQTAARTNDERATSAPTTSWANVGRHRGIDVLDTWRPDIEGKVRAGGIVRGPRSAVRRSAPAAA